MLDNDARLDYLARMGIEIWLPRVPASEVPAVPQGADSPPTEPGSAESSARLTTMAAEVASCTLCPLHLTRKNTVFGVGSIAARCMIIGEGPGAEEDVSGEPFVGRAGRLLNQMLAAIGIGRESVYIANIVKCRPPGNRDPQVQEVAACSQYLKAQIRLVAPELIVTVGRVAAQQLLKSTAPIGRMRGRLYELEEERVPVVVTYHPAYLLRSPDQKVKVWNDLKTVHRLLGNSR